MTSVSMLVLEKLRELALEDLPGVRRLGDDPDEEEEVPETPPTEPPPEPVGDPRPEGEPPYIIT